MDVAASDYTYGVWLGDIYFSHCSLYFYLVNTWFRLAMGFLLGGIISPPDAASITSVLRNVNVPKNIITILEVESLMNDAFRLIVICFAMLTVVMGQLA